MSVFSSCNGQDIPFLIRAVDNFQKRRIDIEARAVRALLLHKRQRHGRKRRMFCVFSSCIGQDIPFLIRAVENFQKRHVGKRERESSLAPQARSAQATNIFEQ